MLVTFQEAPLHFSADYVDEADFAVVEAWKYVDVSTQEGSSSFMLMFCRLPVSSNNGLFADDWKSRK